MTLRLGSPTFLCSFQQLFYNDPNIERAWALLIWPLDKLMKHPILSFLTFDDMDDHRMVFGVGRSTGISASVRRQNVENV